MVTVDPLRVVRQNLWWIVGSAIAGAVLGVIVHYAWLRTAPVHRAFTTWQINLPDSPTEVDRGTQASSEQVDRLMATETAVMTSTNILRPAISTPEVRRTKWIQEFTTDAGAIDIEAAVRDLEERVRANALGDSFLIQLTATGPEKSDLVNILSAVNGEYARNLERRRDASQSDDIDALTKQRDDLRVTLTGLNRTIDEMAAAGINRDPQDSEIAAELRLNMESLTAYVQNLNIARGLAKDYEERSLKEPIEFTDEERAVARLDPNVQGLEGQVINLQTTLRDSMQRFGPNHYTIQRLQSLLASAEAGRDAEIDAALRRNFFANWQAEENRVVALEGVVASLEAKRQDLTNRLADLNAQFEGFVSLTQQRDATQERINALDIAISTAKTSWDRTVALQAQMVSPPEPETVPVMPKLTVLVPLGVLLFAGLVTGFIFLRELTDRRVKGPGDVAIVPHARVLGVIPHAGEESAAGRRVELLSLDAPRSVIAESVRQAQIVIGRRMAEGGHRALLVVGGQPGAGSTAFLSNLAVAFANSERRVLVVDANFRRPQLAEVFGVEPRAGLGDVLAGEAALEQSVLPSRAPGVSVLPAGSAPHRVVERLSTDKFGALIAKAGRLFDVVLVDAPAAVVAGDWQALANQVDATVLVVRAMQEERGLVTRLVNQLRDARAEHLGVVLNGVRSAAGGYLKRNIQQMQQYHRAGSGR